MPKGQINKKFNSKGEEVTSPISVFSAEKFYVGTVYTSYEGDKYIIEEYKGDNAVKIRFLDQYQYSYYTYRSSAVAGNVKNPYKEMKYGGYLGPGEYARKKDEKAYMTWSRMHSRVYKAAHMYTEYMHYERVTICEEWQNFQNFAEWYYNEIKDLNPNFQYSLDKDILQWNQAEKIYAPQYCSMIPLDLNNGLSTYKHIVSKYGLPVGVVQVGTRYKPVIRSNSHNIDYLTGTYETPEEAFEVYREAKIKYIRQLADEFYSHKAITEKIYNGLYNIDILPMTIEQTELLKRMSNKEEMMKQNMEVEIKNREYKIAQLKAELEKYKKKE